MNAAHRLSCGTVTGTMPSRVVDAVLRYRYRPGTSHVSLPNRIASRFTAMNIASMRPSSLVGTHGAEAWESKQSFNGLRICRFTADKPVVGIGIKRSHH